MKLSFLFGRNANYADGCLHTMNYSILKFISIYMHIIELSFRRGGVWYMFSNNNF